MRTNTNKNTKTKSMIWFIICVIVIGLLAYIGAFGVKNFMGYNLKSFNEVINKGLDLKGGVSVVEEIDSKEKINKEVMDRTIELLTSRVNRLGVSETTVIPEGNNKIRIEVPGEYDTKKVIEQVAKAGKLSFVGPDKVEILTGKDVKEATSYISQEGKPIIGLELNESGTKKFADATKKFVGQPIAIYMDEQMLTNPTVNAVITDGKAIIEGSKTMEEAKREADMINSGALPVTLNNVSSKVVGATLGANALPQSVKAGMVGIILVLLFMILYYRVPGLIADITLILYMVLVLGTFSIIGATLTLSGIAAFLLTVGMAVDANVIIFERIKEELKSGKSVKSSIDAGFHRAMTSVLDANFTTIIAGIVLYMFGSGAVKGFALTLIIGVVLSMITAITITKFMIKLAAGMGWFDKKWSIGTFGVHDMRRRVK